VAFRDIAQNGLNLFETLSNSEFHTLLSLAETAKCYLNDPDSERVRDLVKEPVTLASSSLCIPEVSCAIHRRVREKALTHRQGQELCDLFKSHVEERVWTLTPLSDRLLWDVSQAIRTVPAGVCSRRRRYSFDLCAASRLQRRVDERPPHAFGRASFRPEGSQCLSANRRWQVIINPKKLALLRTRL
jgi:hypothetical protein